MNDTIWLKFNDLTEEEKEQAINSYVCIRYEEEQGYYDSNGDKCTEDEAYNRAKNNIGCCSFERMEDGYIFVNM